MSFTLWKSNTYVPSDMIDAPKLDPPLKSLDYFFLPLLETPPIDWGTSGSCSLLGELQARLRLGIKTVFPRSPRDAVRETRPRGATWAESRPANLELAGGDRGGASIELVQLEHVVGETHNTCSWLDDVDVASQSFTEWADTYCGKSV